MMHVLGANPTPPAAEPADAGAFIRRLAAGATVEDAVLVVLAHPDDETLCLGGHLDRLTKGHLVVATDGAPRSGADAAAAGFATPQAYAAARRRELLAALAVAGWGEDRLTLLSVPDQGAAGRMAEIARGLAAIVRARRPGIVVTHAYEGGHPDHDAVAFAVQAASGLAASGGLAFDIVEAPFYRLADGGWARQSFPPPSTRGETAIPLTPRRQDLKRRMLACHASQAATLAAFDIAAERFRPAPRHDFTALPNGGALLYEGQGWGLTGARWLGLVREAAANLSAAPRP